MSMECISRFFDENKIESRLDSDQDQNSTLRLISIEDTSNVNEITTDSEMDDSLSLSQLDIEEPYPIQVQAFFNITPRLMPQSPHYVFEEEFYSNPWAMLIATIFLTKTSARNARSHMKIFFDAYPTPYHVLEVTPMSLERFFETLGLKKRGHMIWKLSYQFVSSKWLRASDLCGVGKYGEDAYRIFCLGHLDVDPDDRYLRLYSDWLRQHTDFIEYESIVDSEFLIEDPILKYYSISLRNNILVT